MRVDVDAASPEAIKHAESQLELCATLGILVELALHLPATVQPAAAWRDLISRPQIRRILVHQQESLCTTARALDLVRHATRRLEIEVGFGTRGDLYELNVERPRIQNADFVFWSMTPQWHATDHLSLAETPETVNDQVRRLRTLFPEVSHVVSPITLLPRMCEPTGAWMTDERPEQESATDPRQQSLAGAAWTLAMISQLTHSGVHAATFYECLGPRGIMPLDSNVRMNLSTAAVYPACFVFEAVAGCSQANRTESTAPSSVATLMLRSVRRRLLVANLSNELQEVEIQCDFRRAALHVLDESNVAPLIQQPELFARHSREIVPASDGCLHLQLQRFSFVQIDEWP
jgi:hypothetical protein